MLTIFILPLFSVIIISLLLIKDDPHGLSKSIIFVNFKFFEKLFVDRKKK